MANRLVLFDDITLRKKLGGVPLTQPLDEQFDIGVGGVVELTSANAFTAQTKIDVFHNGQLIREGAPHSWTRDVATQKILFNYTIPQNAWVMFRLW